MIITPNCEKELLTISKCKLPQNYKMLLQSYEIYVTPYNKKLLFSKLTHNKSLNAAYLGKYISPNAYWALELLTSNDPELFLSFKFTLGHEISHTLKKTNAFLYKMKKWNNVQQYNVNFFAWLNEIYADFNGIVLMCNSNRKDGLKAFKYKANRINNEIIDQNHPTNEQRYYFIQNFDFDERLIRYVAKLQCYPTEHDIKIAINYFPEIILNN